MSSGHPLPSTKHDDLFRGAVALAAAFIGNGDIRLAGSTRADSQAMAQTRDLITTLYEELQQLDAETAVRERAADHEAA